jgi:hypothetical protein
MDRSSSSDFADFSDGNGRYTAENAVIEFILWGAEKAVSKRELSSRELLLLEGIFLRISFRESVGAPPRPM